MYNHGKKEMAMYKKIMITISTFVIIIALACVVLFDYLFGDVTINDIPQEPEYLGISDGAEEVASERKITNIALFGIDSEGANNDSGRSDSIMIASLDQNKNEVKLTSILRDSYVYIDGYGNDKINHAYSYGGPVLAIKTINQNYKMDIKDYVTANFSQFASVIDAVGGIDIDITKDEMLEINKLSTTKLYTYGKVHINGEQALEYSRIRDIDSDTMRANRQKKVIESCMNSLKGESAARYVGVVKAVMPMIETSLSYNDIVGFYSLLSSSTLKQKTIPGDEDNALGGEYNGSWVWRYDLDAAADRLLRFIYEE